MARRWNKNDPTAAGWGAHQSPSMQISHRKYRARLKGELPPLEYGTLEEALEALS